MSVTRRKFVKAGLIAGVFAGIPLKFGEASAVAQKQGARPIPKPGAAATPLANQELLNYYTKSTFTPYINTKFRVHLGPSNIRGVMLREVADYFETSKASKASAGEECFSLLFTCLPGKPFQQGTYTVEHEALGSFPMFVAAVSDPVRSNPNYYESVIFRRTQFVALPESTIVAEKQSPVSAGPTQNDQTAWWVLENPNGQNAKVERDALGLPVNGSSPVPAKTIDPSVVARVVNKLTMAQAPGVNGIKIGMTSTQVLALFPGSREDDEVRFALSTPVDRFGVSSFVIRPVKYSSRAKFEDISQIVFMLMDDRVSTLYVGYDRPLYEHVDELVTKFSDAKSLPNADYWEAYVGLDTQLKSLKAKDFEVSLFAGGNNLNINYVQIRDMVAHRKWKARLKAARESE